VPEPASSVSEISSDEIDGDGGTIRDSDSIVTAVSVSTAGTTSWVVSWKLLGWGDMIIN